MVPVILLFRCPGFDYGLRMATSRRSLSRSNAEMVVDSHQRERRWCGFRRYDLGPDQTFWIGVMVPGAHTGRGDVELRLAVLLVTMVALSGWPLQIERKMTFVPVFELPGRRSS